MRNILRPKQLAKYLSLSLATIWRLQQQEGFPKKIQLSIVDPEFETVV